MPGIYNEYSKPTVSGNGCSYSTLVDYNQNYFGRGGVGAPTLSQARSNEVMILPSFGGKGYKLGASQGTSCSGFQNLKGAYPSYASGNCNAFSSNLCG